MIDKIQAIKVIRSIELDKDSISYKKCPHCNQDLPGALSLVKAKEIADALDVDGRLK